VQVHDLVSGQGPAEQALFLFSIYKARHLSWEDARGSRVGADAVGSLLPRSYDSDQAAFLRADKYGVFGIEHLGDRLSLECFLDLGS
jgi:hypothetical protein